MVLNSASDVDANDLSADDYVKLLSTGEGLSGAKKREKMEAWSGKCMEI